MTKQLICPYAVNCDWGINFCGNCEFGRRLDIINAYQTTNNIIFSNKEVEELIINRTQLDKMKGEIDDRIYWN